ncbi:putative glucose-6-phosphate 1-epimerase isoform X3 [Dendrobium catenatum]|uniref:putative glucose-6-phosphate 1-epimerase isoform X3 n=1 Tax=Dendrobium catenatum TaxID=906689 RepID=UPI0010A0B70A|nr:putative glucose-6-phosphate 1-epimerase isoform X3 [Dendrobium catenatum]
MAACISVAFPVVPIPSSSNPSLHRRRRFAGNVTAAMSQTKDASFGVKVVEGIGGLPKVCLSTAYGSEAEIYLFGACLTSWKLENGKDLLFIRPDAVFNGKKPISGGIPHCFPQFGPGPMQQVTLHSESFSTALSITNTDKKPFSFTTALHTYFSASISGVTVEGLKGCKALNKDPDPANPIEGKEERDVVTFPGFVDCIYLGASNELQLENGLGDTLTIRNTNWPDTVLWNPHTQMESCYRDFVCVENAQVGRVQLKPDQAWVAEQNISFT